MALVLPTGGDWAQPSRLLRSLTACCVAGIIHLACLTNHDTMPGLGCRSETAVGPPVLLVLAPAGFPAMRRSSGLSARRATVEVEAEPGSTTVSMERADVPARVMECSTETCVPTEQVDGKALAADGGSKRHQAPRDILSRVPSFLMKRNAVLTAISPSRVRIGEDERDVS